MGQCLCKDRQRRRQQSNAERSSTHSSLDGAAVPRQGSRHYFLPTRHRPSSLSQRGHDRGTSLSLDVRDLIIETLNVIRTLVNNEQEPPPAMLKLNLIADKEQGWLLIVQTMVDIVPTDNPLGPAVITLFLDESPLPTKETVARLLFYLNLSASLANSDVRPPIWHRNVCIVLGCIAEKLAGPNSVATFKPETLEYLISNLNCDRDPSVILFSLIALEKYAQTSENKVTINHRLLDCADHPLELLENWLSSSDFILRQIGFCSQWALDNLFVSADRRFTYETVDTNGINVMLNHNDVSEYLKISPEGLEARCDVSSFESVRCTFQAMKGVWYYEAVIITPGVMQIGWATKNSKFLNHDGYGIGDDEYSVAYDGCRQLIWHNASSHSHNHPPWKAGDVLGCLLDLDRLEANFYLNGSPLSTPHKDVFVNARSGFFAAASFMSFQQCRFNFGHTPFTYPPSLRFNTFNDHATLLDEQRVILPRHKKLEFLRQHSAAEGACSLCFDNAGVVVLKPCNHTGFCINCAMVLEQCPLCRGCIEDRVEPVLSSGDVSSPPSQNQNVSTLANQSVSSNNHQRKDVARSSSDKKPTSSVVRVNSVRSDEDD